MLLARRLGVNLLFLPHHSTHRLQANDFDVHLLIRTLINVIRNAGRECWTDRNAFIDRFALEEGNVVVCHSTDGMGDGTARLHDLQYAEFRAAHFHTGSSDSSFQWNQRNIVVAAVYAWKFSVTADCIQKAWKKTGLVPFNPEMHKKYSERVERAAPKLLVTEERKQQLVRVRLETASPRFLTLPDAPLPAPLDEGLRHRAALAKQMKENNALADAWFRDLISAPVVLNLNGMDRIRTIALQLNGYLRAVDGAEGRMTLVRGGHVSYQAPTPTSFNDDLAAAKRKQDGIGMTRGLLNVTSKTGYNCGLIFSGSQAKQQQQEASAASAATVSRTSQQATAATARVTRASKAQDAAAAAVQAAQSEAKDALEALRLAEEAHNGPVQLMPSPASPPPTLAPAAPSVLNTTNSASDVGAVTARKAFREARRVSKRKATTLNKAVAKRDKCSERLTIAKQQERDAHKAASTSKAVRKTRLQRVAALKDTAVAAGLSAAGDIGC